MTLDEVRQIVTDELSHLVPADRTLSGSAHFVRDLKIDSDDLTFVLVPNLLRRCAVDIPVAEWRSVGTLDQVIELIAKHLAS